MRQRKLQRATRTPALSGNPWDRKYRLWILDEDGKQPREPTMTAYQAGYLVDQLPRLQARGLTAFVTDCDGRRL